KYRIATAKYCSMDCRDEGYRRKEKKPSTAKKIEKICCQCGVSFLIIPSREKHGRGLHCSPACQYAAIAARPKESITLICLGCGSDYIRYPSHAAGQSGKGKYCSRACRDKHRVGTKHPQYLGGPPCYRGANWSGQKRAARRRDNFICQSCGVDGTDVHHKQPFRLFNDYVIANDLSNLVTLCRPCHRKADIDIQRAAR